MQNPQQTPNNHNKKFIQYDEMKFFQDTGWFNIPKLINIIHYQHTTLYQQNKEQKHMTILKKQQKHEKNSMIKTLKKVRIEGNSSI